MALAAIAVIVLFVLSPAPGPRLRVRDADTGHTFACYRLAEGDEFAVEFVHSINRTPYADLYTLRGGQIYMTGLRYFSFGAGVPEDLDPAWTLTLTEDGGMLVTGMDTVLSRIVYRVGTIFDHFLLLPDGTVNLRELCGRNTRVWLVYG